MKLQKSNAWENVLNANGATGSLIMNEGGLEIVHLNLEPGSEIPPHEMPMDVFFYVESGNPTFLKEGGEEPVSVNDSIYITKGNLRGWKNSSNEPSTILVIKKMQ